MFDRYLDAEPARARTAARRRAFFVGSISLHGVAVVGLIIWSFIHVEEVEPPPLTVSFFSAPPPPPPPPPPKGGKKKENKPKKDVPKPQEIVQPTEVKPIEPTPSEAPEDDGPDEPSGVEGGVEGGVAGGVVGGVVGGVLGGEVAPSEPPKPKNVPPHVLTAAKVSGEDPRLPVELKSMHRGTKVPVRVLICIGQDGGVDRQTTRVMSALPGFAEAVLPTILTWRFKPQAIPICSQWIFNFDIRD
jgi:protein TonB